MLEARGINWFVGMGGKDPGTRDTWDHRKVLAKKRHVDFNIYIPDSRVIGVGGLDTFFPVFSSAAHALHTRGRFLRAFGQIRHQTNSSSGCMHRFSLLLIRCQDSF
jgi:hypothetical protein